MKVLVVCLLATAFFGMGASTPLENVEGEKNVAGETTLDVVEGEEAYSSMDVGVLKEGPGKENTT